MMSTGSTPLPLDLLIRSPLPSRMVGLMATSKKGMPRAGAASGSLAPVLGGEGWGEGPGGEERCGSTFAVSPLTPSLSPEYRGEGAGASVARAARPRFSWLED